MRLHTGDRSIVRVSVTLIALCLATFLKVPAGSAVTGPYDSADVLERTIQDSLGAGSATADAEATVTGTMSAVTTASGSAPLGLVLNTEPQSYSGIGVGGTQATATPLVRETFNGLVPGSYTIRVSFSNIRASIENSPNIFDPNLFGYGTQGGTGFVQVLATVYFYPCALGGSCTARGLGTVYEQPLSDSGAYEGASTLSMPVSLTQSGRILVVAYMWARSQATGMGSSAEARIAATVTSIEVL